MLVFIATLLVGAAGTFLLALGVSAWVRPRVVRRFLLGFAQLASRHYSELALRFAIGTAFIVAAPRMAEAEVVEGVGVLLLTTTAVMLFVPWRSHRSFARRAVPEALIYLPVIGSSAVAAGAAIFWALLGSGMTGASSVARLRICNAAAGSGAKLSVKMRSDAMSHVDHTRDLG